MRIRVDPQIVAANFSQVKDNKSLQESAQLFAAGKPVVEMLQAISMNAGVMRAFAGFADVYPGGLVERSVKEKVILRVSRLHDCQFCVNSHLAMMKQLKIDTDLSPTGNHTPRERIAIEYAERMTADSNRIPDAFFEQLRQLFTEPEIVELTFVIGLITLLNRFNNALQNHYGREFEDVKVAS